MAGADNTKLQKIKEFNAKHSAGSTTQGDGSTTTTKNIDSQVGDGKIDDSQKTARQRVQQKAQETKTPEQIQEEQDALRAQEEQERIDTLRHVTDATSALIDTVNAKIEPAKNWLGSLQTPGGLAAVVIAIIAFALLVIPVNPQGDTRAYLLWQTILGRTHMLYRDTMSIGGNKVSGTTVTSVPVSGSVSSFGSGPSAPPPPQPIDLSHLNLFGFD